MCVVMESRRKMALDVKVSLNCVAQMHCCYSQILRCAVPSEYMLVAEKGRIRGFILNDTNTELKHAIRPIDSVNRPLMLDYDPSRDLVYYSDIIKLAVMEVDLQSGRLRTVLSGLQYPEGVAVDPSAGVVYYADRQLNIIGAVTIGGGLNVPIIYNNLDEPRAIALDIADG